METPLDAAALGRLRDLLALVRRTHLATLTHYISEDEKGSWHKSDRTETASLSSTATCISSLVDAGLWTIEGFPLRGRESDVASELVQKNKSAGLPINNPFSLAFVVEGVLSATGGSRL
jgi:hypothetical protein